MAWPNRADAFVSCAKSLKRVSASMLFIKSGSALRGLARTLRRFSVDEVIDALHPL
jgi:hypothetical protein